MTTLTPRPLSALLSALLFVSTTAQEQEPPPWRSLFDGTSLDGWTGDARIWSVREGCIVGSTEEQGVDANTFLVFEGEEFEDFELTFEARLPGGNNSGVHYRSRVTDPDRWQVVGSQIDVHPRPEYVGMLYEEGLGRGIVAERGQRVESDAAGEPHVVGTLSEVTPLDLTQWHRYRVLARGNTLVHEVDGVVTVEFVDHHPRRLRRGVLALQVHSGPPMSVEFRALRVRRLPAEPDAAATDTERSAATSRAPSPPPQWIWGPETRDGQRLWFQRTVRVPAGVTSAELWATCDNDFEALLNGAPVLSGAAWGRVVRADVTAKLRTGENHLLVRGRNEGGAAGLAVRLTWRTEDGARGELASDGEWQFVDRSGSGEPRPAVWQPVLSLGAVGTAGLPWSNVPPEAFGISASPEPPQAARPADELRLLPGFSADLLYAVPRSRGSWVALTAGPRGLLYASDQQRGLYRIRPATPDGSKPTVVERVAVELGGAQGLLWAFDSLYAVVNSGDDPGLYRLRDTDGDDRLDHVEQLRSLQGAGEHGLHGVVLAPGGKALLVIGGNHAPLPELAGAALPQDWREDTLLPELGDPLGHARGIRAPGGWVCRVEPDGQRWYGMAVGFRNAYDLAVNTEGELFTFDSDMEWDLGLPWYRPTRIVHVVSGGEYGWRTGSGKWPDSYPDSLPPVFEVGPASPTGVLFGTGAHFPERYQRALFALDWTYATLYAVHLEPEGASYRAVELEEFVVGKPLALTDAVVGNDGALYFSLGGRGTQSVLYRVRYTGEDSTELVAAPTARPTSEQALRRTLESFHGRSDPVAVEVAWPQLGHPDRFVRYAARLAVEAQPTAEWRIRALAEQEPAARLTALLALTRRGIPDDRAAVLAALARLPWSELDSEQKLAALRVYSLTFMRLGAPTPEQRAGVLAFLEPRMPSGDAEVDRELARLLVHLEAPTAAAKLVAKLDAATPAAPPWAELAGRNAAYGGTVLRMLEDMPPVEGLHYAHLLRSLESGWTPELRERYFACFPRAARHPGGMSYTGFLEAMRADALAACSEEQRSALGRLARVKLERPAPFPVQPPRGPGRAWTLDEAVALARIGLQGRDFEAGRNLFFATACSACHHFDGEGGSVGPDLSTVGNKFGVPDLLAAMLEPSAVISDQYGSSDVLLRDGTSLFGRVVERPGGELIEVYSPDPELGPELISRTDVTAIEPSPLSQMPEGLVNTLNSAELLDLLAYLLSGGDRAHPMFAR